jgi:hypothetical protein
MPVTLSFSFLFNSHIFLLISEKQLFHLSPEGSGGFFLSGQGTGLLLIQYGPVPKLKVFKECQFTRVGDPQHFNSDPDPS